MSDNKTTTTQKKVVSLFIVADGCRPNLSNNCIKLFSYQSQKKGTYMHSAILEVTFKPPKSHSDPPIFWWVFARSIMIGFEELKILML